jgi:hypothetical protein
MDAERCCTNYQCLPILSSVSTEDKTNNWLQLKDDKNSPFWGAVLTELALSHAREETLGVKVSYDTFNRVLSKIVLRQTVNDQND